MEVKNYYQDSSSNSSTPTELTVNQLNDEFLGGFPFLDSWGHLSVLTAGRDPAFWTRLLESRVIASPLAEALVSDAQTLEALAAAVRSDRSPNGGDSRDYTGTSNKPASPATPAFCVMIGVPLSEYDEDFDAEEVTAWDSVVTLEESREDAVRKVQAAVECERSARPRVVLTEGQLRQLAIQCRSTKLRQIPEDDPSE